VKVFLSPQRNDNKIQYTFKDESITVTYKNVTDIFDLVTFPEGAQFEGVTTSLEIDPILDIKRKSGVLYVTLLNSLGAKATEEENFPIWVEAAELQAKYDAEREVEIY